MAHCFAGYPSTFVRDAPDGKKVQQLVWGDYIRIDEERADGWLRVRARAENGWVHADATQPHRLLEVNFVDVGQGDGCFIVTPEDEKLLIDAGEGDNMYRFLRWRFGLRRHPDRQIGFQYAIISHPDADHYRGFQPIFASPSFTFETVFHNGLVERDGTPTLGGQERISGRTYQTDLRRTRDELRSIIEDDTLVGQKWYPTLLRTAHESGRVNNIEALTARTGRIPGYTAEGPDDLRIDVLGPVPEENPRGGLMLRRFQSNDGKTKNGHSILLKVLLGRVRLLLGGDLNIPAEEYLLHHYTGINPATHDPNEQRQLLERARTVFEADIAKACHHGSADFMVGFIQAVNAIATIVSSGDAESHCHPRPDTLGALGRHGRGTRPLIFSTELARSTKERITVPARIRERLAEIAQERAHASSRDAARLDEEADRLWATLERAVAVYGMITVLTDGTKVVLSQKLEVPRTRTREEFDLHRLEPTPDGGLQYLSRH